VKKRKIYKPPNSPQRVEEITSLEERTKTTIRSIAELMGIDESTYADALPTVSLDPNATTSNYHPKKSHLTYITESPVTRYEECAHFLHMLVNPAQKHKLGNVYMLFNDFRETFFSGCLAEAFGYFASKFSGEEREEEYFKSWKEYTEQLGNKIKDTKELAEHALKFLPDTDGTIAKILESTNLEDQRLQRHKHSIEAGDTLLRLLEEGDLQNRDTQWFILQAVGDALLATDHAHPEEITPFCRLYHVLGYDLGAALYNAYKDDESKLQLVKNLINAKPEEAQDVFFKTATAVKEYHYAQNAALASKE
jgi:hypothetical protein